MWKPTGLCVKLHTAREEQVLMGPVHRLVINFSLTPELARYPGEALRNSRATPQFAPRCG